MNPVAWRVEYRMPNGRIAGTALFGAKASAAFARSEANQETTITPLYEQSVPSVNPRSAVDRVLREHFASSGYPGDQGGGVADKILAAIGSCSD